MIASSVAGALALIVLVLSLLLFGALIYCKLKQNEGNATINSNMGMCGDDTMTEIQTDVSKINS